MKAKGSFFKLWLRTLAMVLWPPLLWRWTLRVAEQKMEFDKCCMRNTALQQVLENYERPPETTLDIGDCEPCGCDESKLLRRRLQQYTAVANVCISWRDEYKPLNEDHLYDFAHERNSKGEALPELATMIYNAMGWYEPDETDAPDAEEVTS